MTYIECWSRFGSLGIPNFCSKGLILGLAIFSVDFLCERFLSTLQTLQFRAFLKPPLLIVTLLAEGNQVFLSVAVSLEMDSFIPTARDATIQPLEVLA